jgi:predicted transcriptional regulator of viral defense system
MGPDVPLGATNEPIGPDVPPQVTRAERFLSVPPARIVAMHLITGLGQALEDAADQNHLLATSDLTRLGLDRKQVARLCDHRIIERIVRGLYRVAGTRSPQQDIAAAVCRHAVAVASHESALWLHDIDVDPPEPPHLTLPPGATSHTTLGVLHRSPLERIDVTRRRGIPVTTLARAVVDASAHLSVTALHEVTAQAVTARRTTVRHIEEAARRVEAEPGRIGHGTLRTVLESWSGRIRPDSVAEATVLRRIVGFGLARPVTQHEVRDGAGRFVARVDLAWPDERVCREYDSDGYHPPPKVEEDERRRARIEAAGWSVGVIHRGHLLPSREDWLRRLAEDLRRRQRRAG